MSEARETLTREDFVEAVKHPGKYEGENPYVPYFDELVLCGGEDYLEGEEDNPIYCFVVTEEDTKLFPELTVGEVIKLTDTNDGFVCEVK